MKDNLKLVIQTGKCACGSKNRSGLCTHMGVDEAQSLLMHTDSERNDTVDGIYHTGWVQRKPFNLKRTETQKGMTGGNESLAAVKNHRLRFLI